jgi:hypothetical protein
MLQARKYRVGDDGDCSIILCFKVEDRFLGRRYGRFDF